MAAQELLATALRERLIRAGATGPFDEPVDDGWAAVVVLRRFEPATLARSALRFAVQLDPDRGEPWLRAFTRTVFLAGNPANLRQRFPLAHLAPDRSIAWYGPAPAADLTGLRRLLKVFPSGRLPVPTDLHLRVPGDDRGGARRLLVATAGLTTAGYLVHLHHALVEAVLAGPLRPGDRVHVKHVPDIDDSALADAEAVRVHRDLADPRLLRAYASLSRPVP